MHRIIRLVQIIQTHRVGLKGAKCYKIILQDKNSLQTTCEVNLIYHYLSGITHTNSANHTTNRMSRSSWILKIHDKVGISSRPWILFNLANIEQSDWVCHCQTFASPSSSWFWWCILVINWPWKSLEKYLESNYQKFVKTLSWKHSLKLFPIALENVLKPDLRHTIL